MWEENGRKRDDKGKIENRKVQYTGKGHRQMQKWFWVVNIGVLWKGVKVIFPRGTGGKNAYFFVENIDPCTGA
jgi:hypothetical protein